jgi:hypothetical protein
VKSVSAVHRNGCLRLRCEAAGNHELEAWGVARRAELLARVLGQPLRLDFVAEAAAPRRARA